jgi:YgiT-type zinc finger domain-containing protein
MNKCVMCGGTVNYRKVDVERKWQNRLVIIEGVPANVCEQCGEQYYDSDVHWVEPLLAAEIEFQEWTPDLKLRQPVFIKLLDVPPQTCSLFPDSQRNKKTEGKQQ